MCGLTGFFPKSDKKANMEKLFAMWIVNEERGTDSCGITIGNYKYGGVQNNKAARTNINEIINYINNEDLLNKPVIAHTRKATNGANNLNNAHPFIWTFKNQNYFTFAHNGIIKNENELKQLAGISEWDENLFKIDSHTLGLSIAATINNKKIDTILKSYQGKAAFLAYSSSGNFYAWKGANNNIVERPLYYVESSEGWYFCSIPEILSALFIGNEIIEVPNNTLIIINNKGILTKEIYERNIVETLTTNNNYNYSNYYGNYNKFTNNSNKAYNSIFNTNSSKNDDNLFDKFVKFLFKNNKNIKFKNHKITIIPINNSKTLAYEDIKLASFRTNKCKYYTDHAKNLINGTYIFKSLSNKMNITFIDGIAIKDVKAYNKLLKQYQYFYDNKLPSSILINYLGINAKACIIDIIPLYNPNINVNDSSIPEVILYKNKNNELKFVNMSKILDGNVDKAVTITGETIKFLKGFNNELDINYCSI